MSTSTITIEVTQDFVSGYQLAKYATKYSNRVEVKPQQIYNYMSKGLIKTVVHEDRKMVTKVDAIKWLTKYCSKH